MTRLLWKEFRERRGWFLCWVLCNVLIALCAHGQSFCGEGSHLNSGWQVLSLLMAFFVSAGGYTSELEAQRVNFFFSRPLRWHTILLAKLLSSAVLLLGAPLLAAGIFCLMNPEYAPLMTLPHVLAGVLRFAVPMSLPFLFGLACSAVLPGLAGGFLTAIAIFCFLIVCITVKYSPYELSINNDFSVFLYSAMLATIFAAVPLLPSRLMLATPDRLKLFIPIFIGVFTLLVILINITNMQNILPVIR